MKTKLLLLTLALFLINCEKKEKVQEEDNRPIPTGEKLVVEASQILGKNGCLGCHSEDGARLVGPTFKGIWGRKTKLNTGKEIIVDSAYIVRSIVNSSAEIVDGYLPGQMPITLMKPYELNVIVAYFKTL